MRSRTRIDGTDRVLQEVEDGEVAVSLRREDVATLSLRYGSGAERPWLQLAFATVAAACAAYLLWRVSLFLWAGRAHGDGWAALAGGGSIALLISVALVRRALVRRHFVLATLHDGTRRKVLLPPEWSDAERAELEARLRELGWTFDPRA